MMREPDFKFGNLLLTGQNLGTSHGLKKTKSSSVNPKIATRSIVGHHSKNLKFSENDSRKDVQGYELVYRNIVGQLLC